MKKKIALLMVLVSIATIVSCKDKNNNFNNSNNSIVSNTEYLKETEQPTYIDISEIYPNINSITEELRKTKYKNLNLSEITVEFPNITEYYNLTLKLIDEKKDFDNKIDTIRSIVNIYCPEQSFSENYLVWWADEIEQYPNGYPKYPKVLERKEKIINSKYNGTFVYETDIQEKHENDIYMALNPYTFSGHIIRDNGSDIIGTDLEHLSGWMPENYFQKIERYYVSNLPNKSYKIYDNNVSVKEAVKYATDFFCNDYKTALPDSPIMPEISAVDVMQYEDTYAYRFHMKNMFKGIPFDYSYDNGSIIGYSDGKDYGQHRNFAFMTKSNTIDVIYTDHPFASVDYDDNAVKNIIPLQEAIKIMSNKLSEHVVFNVISAEFVYSTEISNTNTVEAIYSSKPIWKITAYNPNDEWYYIIHIDVLNGTLRYCQIQPD